MLAPGNIPAFARRLPCTFVVMTSQRDEPLIRHHPAWHRLAEICDVEVELIDDLITDGNHSTTITLAFTRAVRESGTQMLDTCFIFSVCDYHGRRRARACAHACKPDRAGSSHAISKSSQRMQSHFCAVGLIRPGSKSLYHHGNSCVGRLATYTQRRLPTSLISHSSIMNTQTGCLAR